MKSTTRSRIFEILSVGMVSFGAWILPLSCAQSSENEDIACDAVSLSEQSGRERCQGKKHCVAFLSRKVSGSWCTGATGAWEKSAGFKGGLEASIVRQLWNADVGRSVVLRGAVASALGLEKKRSQSVSKIGRKMGGLSPTRSAGLRKSVSPLGAAATGDMAPSLRNVGILALRQQQLEAFKVSAKENAP